MEPSEYKALEREVELICFGGDLTVNELDNPTEFAHHIYLVDLSYQDTGMHITCIDHGLYLWHNRFGKPWQKVIEDHAKQPVRTPRPFCTDYNALHSLHVRVAEAGDEVWEVFSLALAKNAGRASHFKDNTNWFGVITEPWQHCQAAINVMRKDAV